MKRQAEELKEMFPNLKHKIESCEKLIIKHPELLKEIIIDRGKGDLRVYHFLIIGTLSRSRNISEAIIRESREGNLYAVIILLRALMETTALLNYVKRHPDYLEKATWASNETEGKVKIWEIIEELSEEFKNEFDLKSDYIELCLISHPLIKSHLLNVKISNEKERKFTFSDYSPKIEEKELEEKLNAIINLMQINLNIVDEIDKMFTS